MTAARAQLEGTLCTAYREEAELYRQALALCEQQLAAPATPVDDWLPRLVHALDGVAAIEARIAVDKRDWQRQQHTAGAELAGRLARLAELLQTLAGAVERVISALEAQRRTLPAALTALAPQHRGRLAYQQAARAGRDS